jgi:hypothetical protein
MGDGIDNFVRLEARVIMGLASAEELELYRETTSLAHGDEDETGVLALLRQGIADDRKVIQSFPNLLELGATEINEDLYAARVAGMYALLGDLESILLEVLSE